MRWVLMLFVVLATVMGGEARIDCSAGPGGAWPIGGNGLGERVLTGEAEMRLEPGAGELAAGGVLAAWRGEPVAVLANLREADTATWNLEVENEHVDWVGPAGILVLSTCPTPKELFEGRGGLKTKATTGAETVNYGVALRSNSWRFVCNGAQPGNWGRPFVDGVLRPSTERESSASEGDQWPSK